MNAFFNLFYSFIAGLVSKRTSKVQTKERDQQHIGRQQNPGTPLAEQDLPSGYHILLHVRHPEPGFELGLSAAGVVVLLRERNLRQRRVLLRRQRAVHCRGGL